MASDVGGIRAACEMTGLSPSTFYYKPTIDRIEREKQDADLRDKIEEIHSDLPKAGYRPMQVYLQKHGIRVGERRLRRVIRKYGLFAEIKRAFVITSQTDHELKRYPNLLPEMGVTGLDQVWVADITYIRIRNGFVYLAVILDVYSRRVVGWAISKRLTAEIALEALQCAIDSRKPKPGLIHHSDQGVQYLCEDYIALLSKHGIRSSCSRRGNPYDNAFAESFFKTLKRDEVYLWEYETYIDVIERLPIFIEEVYNTIRVHSSLGYLTPVEFEDKVRKTPQDQPVLIL
ncbi:MAG: IS3 family transposase [Leptolyngbyaceae cyanobacterium bins.302]|nr:IS3 family transposase [Leptolyngbyaceae cyanobacterium bins.302]